MNRKSPSRKSAGAATVSLAVIASAASADPLELKGFVFGQTTIDEWKEAVYEERAGTLGTEVVAPFCGSGESDYPSNDLYFTDESHNPDLGIESCFRYAPGCATCVSSLAQAATDGNQWTFLDGTLVRVSATLYRTQLLNNLLNPLIAKYGEPDEISSQVVSNSFGAQFESRSWAWHLDSLEIIIVERAGQVDKSFISFSEPDLEMEMSRRLMSVVPDTSNL